MALFEGHFHWRFPGGLSTLAEARSQRPAHRLCLGGWRLLSAKNGRKTMRSGPNLCGRIGVDEWGRKEILGLIGGYRESTQSWREVFGGTTEQRCWLHKTGNVLNAMPKSE